MSELPYAIEHGAIGATSDSSIIFPLLKATLGEWKERAHQIVPGHPTWDEEQIVQQTCGEVGVRDSTVVRHMSFWSSSTGCKCAQKSIGLTY